MNINTKRTPVPFPNTVSPYVSSSALCELLEKEDEMNDSAILTASSTLVLPSPTPLSSTFPFLARITSGSIQWRGSAPLDFCTPPLFPSLRKEENGCIQGILSSVCTSTDGMVKSCDYPFKSDLAPIAVRNKCNSEDYPSEGLPLHPVRPSVCLREEFLLAEDTMEGVKNSAFSPEKGYCFPLRPWTADRKREAGIRAAQQMFLEEYGPAPPASLSSWDMKVGHSSPYSCTSSSMEKSFFTNSSLSKSDATTSSGRTPPEDSSRIGEERLQRIPMLRLRPFFLRQTALQVLLLLQMQQQEEEKKKPPPSSFSVPLRSRAKVWLLDCTPTMLRFAVLPSGVIRSAHPSPRVFRLLCLPGDEKKEKRRSKEEKTRSRRHCGVFRSLLRLCVPSSVGPYCPSCGSRRPRQRSREEEEAFISSTSPPCKTNREDSCLVLEKGGTSARLLWDRTTSNLSQADPHSRALSLKAVQEANVDTVVRVKGKDEGWKTMQGIFQLVEEKKKSHIEHFSGVSPSSLQEEQCLIPPLPWRPTYFYWDPTEKQKHVHNAERANPTFSLPSPLLSSVEDSKLWESVPDVLASLQSYETEVKDSGSCCKKATPLDDGDSSTTISWLGTTVEQNVHADAVTANVNAHSVPSGKEEADTTCWAAIRFVSWIPFRSASLAASSTIRVNAPSDVSSFKEEHLIPENVAGKNTSIEIVYPTEESVREKEVIKNDKFRTSETSQEKERGGKSAETSTPASFRPSHRNYLQCMEDEVKNWSFSLFTLAAHLCWCEYILDKMCSVSLFCKSTPQGSPKSTLSTTVRRSKHDPDTNGDVSFSPDLVSPNSWNSEVNRYLILLANPYDDKKNLSSTTPLGQHSLPRRRRWSSFVVLTFFKKITPFHLEKDAEKNLPSTPSALGGKFNGIETKEEEKRGKCFILAKVDGCSETLQWTPIQELHESEFIRLQERKEHEEFGLDGHRDLQDTKIHSGTLHDILSFIVS